MSERVTKMVTHTLTAAALAAMLAATPALALDANKTGNKIDWEGTCHTLSVEGVNAPFCFNRLSIWISDDGATYLIKTYTKQTEGGSVTRYVFGGSHAFIGREGEVDTFLIDQLWVTKTINGKVRTVNSEVGGKCTSLIDDQAIYFDCQIRGKKSPAIKFKFSGQKIKGESDEHRS